MFVFLQADPDTLTPEEQERYHAVYCGLCQSLRKRHGQLARFSLTYDMTFLILLYASLYETLEQSGTIRCIPHPVKPHRYAANQYTDYAADMSIALMYYKCMDDWKDEKNHQHKRYASILRHPYREVRFRYRSHCNKLEKDMQKLSKIEEQHIEQPDAAANCFGELLRSVYIHHPDCWSEDVGNLGYHLGRYIYLADAAIDLEDDRKHGRYNPFLYTDISSESVRQVLMNILGEASACFEALPLEQDAALLRNILYSGIWSKFNSGMQNRKEAAYG